MADVVELTGNNPRVREALSSELLSQYRKDVFPEGEDFSQQAHSNFLGKYEDHINQLLSPAEQAMIRNAEDAGKVLNLVKARNDRVEKALSRAYGPLWSKNDPLNVDSMARRVFSSSRVTGQNIARLVKTLEREDPALLTGLRVEGARLFASSLRGNTGFKGAKSIRDQLNKSESKLAALYGDGYVKHMRAVADAVSVFDDFDSVMGLRDPKQSWTALARIFWGPLDPKHRFITGTSRLVRARGARKAVQLMSSPESLRAFVRLKSIPPTDWPKTNWAINTIADLGLGPFIPVEFGGMAQMDGTGHYQHGRL
jgi:hypothetical protein